jgi:hypothetical protein
MQKTILETIIQVYEIGFYADEKVITGDTPHRITYSNTYGPFPSWRLAYEESQKQRLERDKEYKAKNEEFVVVLYDIREDRRLVKKEVVTQNDIRKRRK